MGFDSRWYLAANRLSELTPWLHPVAAAYALWAGLVLLAVLLIAAWWTSARRGEDPARRVATAVVTGLGTVLALGANQPLSAAVARPRPFITFPNALVLLQKSADFSFPSDHLMIAGAFVAGFWCLDRRLGAVSLLFSVALAFARVYSGVHYPSDVVAGLVVGAAIGAAMQFLVRGPVGKLLRAAEATRFRPLVRRG